MKTPATCWLWSFVLAAVALFDASVCYGSSSKHLPIPAGLAKAVAFWEKVFSEYSPDECAFHDRDDLSIVYAVSFVPKGSQIIARRLIKKHLNDIRMALKNFADGSAPRTKLEKQVYYAVPPVKRNSRFFTAARKNIRCQRGVDLKPSLDRSKKYLSMVKRVLKRNNLPTDLAYLPHLESGYQVKAHSKAGARGIWQLMPATARLNGLKVTRHQDSRLDPYMATKTAARILSNLRQQMGSWPLAITAYNYGPNGMARAIKKHGVDYMRIRSRHQTRVFGFASKNYYPSFLAVRNVAIRLESGEDFDDSDLESKEIVVAAKKASKKETKGEPKVSKKLAFDTQDPALNEVRASSRSSRGRLSL